MHELPVTQKIFDLAMKNGKDNQAKKINTITIEMGEGCDFVPEIIQEYFQIFAEGTIADGAKIIPRLIPTTILCKNCGAVHKKDLNMYTCPVCGSDRLRPQIYSDLKVAEIAMEF